MDGAQAGCLDCKLTLQRVAQEGLQQGGFFMQQLPVTHLPSTQQQKLQYVLFGTHLYSQDSHQPYMLLSKAPGLCSLVMCAKLNIWLQQVSQ